MSTNSYPFINPTQKFNYEIGIRYLKTGQYQTFVLGYPRLKALGNSREEAIKNLSERVQAFLKDTEIIQLEIELEKPEPSSMKVAGLFENDPRFEKFLKAIEDYRNTIDAEIKD